MALTNKQKIDKQSGRGGKSAYSRDETATVHGVGKDNSVHVAETGPHGDDVSQAEEVVAVAVAEVDGCTKDLL